MREPVVILSPDVGRKEIIERRDGPPPRDVIAHLQPLGVLVEHRVNDVDKRLVTGEEPMSAREQIAFEPTLALVLAQHFHHPTVGCELVVVIEPLRHPGAIGDFEHVLPAVRIILVRTEQTEVLAVEILLHHVAEKLAHDARGLGAGRAGFLDFDRVLAEIRQAQSAQEQAAVGVRIGAHAACAFRRKLGEFGFQATAPVEQFFRLVALHPAFEDLDVTGFGHVAHRDLMRPPRTLGAFAVHGFWARPPLR